MNLHAPLRHALVASTLLAFGLVGAQAASGSGGGSTSGVSSSSSSATEVPGEIMVKLRSTAALAPLMAKYPVTLVSRFGARPIYRLKVVGNVRVKDILGPMSLEPDVLIAEANLTHRSPEARKNVVWAIGSPQAYAAQWAPQAMRLAEAQALNQGAGVRVAVLDTGVDATHPALAGRLLPGFDFVDYDTLPAEGSNPNAVAYGHGTHVAGLVALVAPAAQIMPLRVLDEDGVGNAWVLSEALLYAIDPDGNPDTDDGAHVINLSLGSLSRTRIVAAIAHLASCASEVNDDPVADRSDPGYNDDRRRCSRGKGTVVVAAAGNDGSSGVKQYPAAEGAPELLSVGASTSAKQMASFSNTGSWVQIAAPGDFITSSVPGGAYGTWSGTSMAAPLAAGAAALVRSANPSMAPKDVVERIRRASAPLCSSTGLRQVDAAAALTNVVPAPISCK